MKMVYWLSVVVSSSALCENYINLLKINNFLVIGGGQLSENS